MNIYERQAHCILKKILPTHVIEPQYKFHPFRRWRFDFAIPSLKIAIEINGGVWSNGRHSRGSGLVKEYEKMRAAAVLHWYVFAYDPKSIHLITEDISRFLEEGARK
jgi:hypothetical protein